MNGRFGFLQSYGCPQDSYHQPLMLCVFLLCPWLVDTDHKKSSAGDNLHCSQTQVNVRAPLPSVSAFLFLINIRDGGTDLHMSESDAASHTPAAYLTKSDCFLCGSAFAGTCTSPTLNASGNFVGGASRIPFASPPRLRLAFSVPAHVPIFLRLTLM